MRQGSALFLRLGKSKIMLDMYTGIAKVIDAEFCAQVVIPFLLIGMTPCFVSTIYRINCKSAHDVLYRV